MKVKVIMNNIVRYFSAYDKVTGKGFLNLIASNF